MQLITHHHTDLDKFVNHLQIYFLPRLTKFNLLNPSPKFICYLSMIHHQPKRRLFRDTSFKIPNTILPFSEFL
jgi:hypothetical protein